MQKKHARPASAKNVDQRNATFMDRLLGLSEALIYQTDFDELLRLVNSSLVTLFEADVSSITMVNPHTHNTMKTIIREGNELKEQQLHLINNSIIGWMMKYNREFFAADIRRDKRFRISWPDEVNLASFLAAPLVMEGLKIGFAVIGKGREAVPFRENEVENLKQFCALVSPFLSSHQHIQNFFLPSTPTSVLVERYAEHGLIGRSGPFSELLKSIEAASKCPVKVVLIGQSGTGKELVARAIHRQSERRNNPFVAVDCGAIPENLIESELFGHIKGAFTGAVSDRKGLFEMANGGTLFMDEIANLSLSLQAKMLRVLQENEIRPLGSNQTKKIDVRIISASSVSLTKLVENRQFREDLFFRLHVYPIYMPSLQERWEDIPYLARHFLEKFAALQKKSVNRISGRLLNLMMQLPWPGNIRELENFMERLITLLPPDSELLDTSVLPGELARELKIQTPLESFSLQKKGLNESLMEMEAQMIREALQNNNWNQSRAARVLQISEQTIRYKMKKLGIQKF